MRADAPTRFAARGGDTWSAAWTLAGAVQLGGFALDFVRSGRGLPALAWPDGGLALFAFIAVIVGLRLLLGRLAPAWLDTLGGTRLGVVCLVVLGLWAAPLGIFAQVATGPAPIHLRVLSAPPFIAALLLLLATLAWAMLAHLARGLRPSSLFLVNHLGVFIAVAASLFGAGDVRRLDIWVAEGDLAWTGTPTPPDTDRTPVELPFALHLHTLAVDHYPPRLTLLRASDGESLLPRGAGPLPLAPGLRATLADHAIEVLEFTENAPWSPLARDPLPAARLRVVAPDGRTSEGWVTAGHGRVPPLYLGLGATVAALTDPRPREFRSDLTLVEPGRTDGLTTSVRVNHPLRHDGWWIYQKGFDTDRADGRRWSRLEAVRDPWLPALYTGLSLMALGALLALARAASLARATARALSPNVRNTNIGAGLSP